MKRKGMLVIIFMIFFSCTTFSEVDLPSSWAEESIEELSDLNLLRNDVFGSYQDKITRSEFIYLAVRVYEILGGQDIDVDASISFTDTDDVYALKAATVGISTGVGNNRFDPDSLLTREQLAVLILNTMKLIDLELKDADGYRFNDENEFSNWAADSIYIAKANGIISGVGNDRFDSKANATNEVALIIINKIIKNNLIESEIEHPHGTSSTNDLMQICYEVTIDDFDSGKANIKLKIRNINDNKIMIRNHGYHGFFSNIKDFDVVDEEGHALTHQLSKVFAESFGTDGLEWVVYPNGQDTITIEYEVFKQNLVDGNQYKGYIGNGFGLFTGEQLIGLFPSETNKWDEHFHVVFNVPRGAEVVTPWLEDKGVYYPNEGFYSDDNDFIDKEDNMMQSSIAIGNFNIVNKDVGNTEVRVAVPGEWTDDRQVQISENVFNLIAYYNTLFGKSIGDYYLMAYSPETHDQNRIWAGEWSLSQASSITGNNLNLTMVAHQIFHRWNGWTWGWQTNADQMGPLLMEGNNRYYEGKSMIVLSDQLNLANSNDINYLESLYDQYLDYYNQGLTIPYYTSSALADGVSSWTAYAQGALIWFLFDMELLEDTSGEVSVDDIMKAVDEKYGRHNGDVDYAELKQIIIQLTGQSYDGFFNDYVFGEKFLDLNQYFDDSDGDQIPNYYEIINGTDPDVSNTDPSSNLQKHFMSSNALIIGSREECEAFHDKFGIGTNLTGNPTSNQMEVADMIVLLDTNRYTSSGLLSVFDEINDKEMSVKSIDGKLYVYIQAASTDDMIELINTIEFESLFVEQ